MTAEVLEAGGIAVRFSKQGDRYAHRVELVEGGACRPLLESREGTADEDWPPSPPLQSLHVESRELGRTVALLVGMAGTSHWSLSVEADPQARVLTFDAACRAKQPPQFLGSSYAALLPMQPVQQTGGGVLLAGGWLLSAEAIDGQSPAVWEQSAEGVRLSLPLQAAAGPRTWRWKYVLRPM